LTATLEMNKYSRESSHLQMTIKFNTLPLACAALTIFSANTLQADAAWKKSITPFKPGPHRAIKPVQLTYDVSWNGALKAGKLSFIFGKKDKRYPGVFISQLYGQTGSRFKPYNYSMTSFTKDKTFNPILCVSNEKDKKEEVSTTNRYRSKGVDHKSKTTLRGSGKILNREHNFAFPVCHDPLSALLFIRGKKLNNGDNIKLCLHPFNSPYVCSVRVAGRELHNKRKCIKLEIDLKKIDKKTFKLLEYKKLSRSATLWISDDHLRHPIELRANLKLGSFPLGSVRASLIAAQAP